MTEQPPYLAQGRSDATGRLVSAVEPLLGLQHECGGVLPGPIAIPALRELEEKSRSIGLKLARTMRASNGREMITAWIEIEPLADAGCEIRVLTWQVSPLPPEDTQQIAEHRAAIDRALAELTARLDERQGVLAVQADATDLRELAAAMQAGIGQPWTDFVSIDGAAHHQPMHWRLLDGAKLTVPGSERSWRASLFPQQVPGADPTGFELCLTAEAPLPRAEPRPLPGSVVLPNNGPGLVGRDIAPVLRQPIARIIANAETIRTRMAGPLADEYSQYAADISSAGEHLLALIEGLADLEVVESDEFNTAPDRIDLADVARRASGILGVRAQERGIVIDAPKEGEHLPAIAEFRRVLQILLNLVGNAIRYTPENSQIWIRLEDAGGKARLIVADQGPGLSDEQQAKVFEKFERLGRSNEDGGSGLGLYISRRLARAMGGDLTVESAPGQGARFILDVPADLLALAPTTAQNPD
ncbi:HAMP domain-containing sensor histidine kinase [Novosphingobium sp.]|uniref:sensor histidine kinase n=1 Tax=Novosphingobium sp. TaxID=1874826 RepID=UPI0025DA753D|nr:MULTISPECIES: HAMP domain-containing sensor histidine kinase [unclassified Novosphingobium]HQV02654.1 HAMP domain-containing sensor histidine kinase [Novosphingobium sp.]